MLYPLFFLLPSSPPPLSGEQVQQKHRPRPARHRQVCLQIRAEETELPGFEEASFGWRKYSDERARINAQTHKARSLIWGYRAPHVHTAWGDHCVNQRDVFLSSLWPVWFSLPDIHSSAQRAVAPDTTAWNWTHVDRTRWSNLMNVKVRSEKVKNWECFNL